MDRLEEFFDDLTAARKLERERVACKGRGRKWARMGALFDADAVLRRARI